MAVWVAGNTVSGPDVEQGLVERPSPTRRHQAVGELLRGHRTEWVTGNCPRKQPGHVRVDHTGIDFEGKRQNGPGCVGAHPWKRNKGSEIYGNPATVAFNQNSGGPMEIDGSAVVAEPLPGHHDVGDAGRRAGRRGREAFYEAPVGTKDSGHLGLLEHHLAHQHVPRIPSGPPGQITTVGLAPPQHGLPQRAQPGARRNFDGQLQTSSLYGRRRIGAPAFFHTITLRRKKHTSSARWLNALVSTLTTPRSSLDMDSTLSMTLVSA